jgi:hypothetical protein
MTPQTKGDFQFQHETVSLLLIGSHLEKTITVKFSLPAQFRRNNRSSSLKIEASFIILF